METMEPVETNWTNQSDPGANEYEYDYDMETSANTFFWAELVPTLVVYGVTLLIGMAGNSLIIFTITSYRGMKSTTNLFLASLAIADLLLIIICIPVKVAKLFSYSWTMGMFLCKLVHYLQGVSAICSVLTLTAMSLERYYAIVHPMKAKYVCTLSQARKVILFIWFASLFLAVPIVLVQIHMPVGERHPAFWCVRDWASAIIWRAHELYMFFLILVFPTSVMAAAYTSICWEISKVMKRRNYMTSGTEEMSFESYYLALQAKNLAIRPNTRMDDDGATIKQVIRMLVAVVVVFVVCWGPMLTDNLLTAWGTLPHIRTGPLKHMATIFHLMAYFNSCVNPIVYGFMSRSFRESFCKALCFKSRLPSRQLSMSQSLKTGDCRFAVN